MMVANESHDLSFEKDNCVVVVENLEVANDFFDRLANGNL